ncbi:hypothetical protein LCGC14_1214790 [marine sediment metagenome]|uniref:Uncharacterized protein n=1 Tax=marine sediment metagenome TaxID=412755 RepID=A0A0F9LD77_9ZZZZ
MSCLFSARIRAVVKQRERLLPCPINSSPGIYPQFFIHGNEFQVVGSYFSTKYHNELSHAVDEWNQWANEIKKEKIMETTETTQARMSEDDFINWLAIENSGLRPPKSFYKKFGGEINAEKIMMVVLKARSLRKNQKIKPSVTPPPPLAAT